jgi:hypothetical protein
MTLAEPAVHPDVLAHRARPVSLARERVLPVLDGLAPLVPGGGVQRGSVVAVSGPGATSLGLALAAGASQAGSWTVAIGLASLGLQAADEFGVSLARLVLVAAPEPEQWATVVATALDGFDVVLLQSSRRSRAADARRLQARARQRGPVLVVLDGAGGPAGHMLEPDLAFRVAAPRWEGMRAGSGHLRARCVQIEVGGRRARPGGWTLWLPDHDGQVHVDEPVAAVVPISEHVETIG